MKGRDKRPDNYEFIIGTLGVNYMAKEAPSRGGWFIKGGWGFHGLLVHFRVFLVLRWVMLEKVLGATALWGRLYIAAKPSQGQIWIGQLAPTLTWGPRLLGRGDRV
jgi:hypothetical protein